MATSAFDSSSRAALIASQASSEAAIKGFDMATSAFDSSSRAALIASQASSEAAFPSFFVSLAISEYSAISPFKSNSGCALA